MPTEIITRTYLKIGTILTIIFAGIAGIAWIHALTTPKVAFLDPLSAGAGIVSALVAVVSGSATFGEWMRNTKNRLMANIIFRAFEECGPLIHKQALKQDVKGVFNNAKRKIETELNKKGLIKKIAYRATHWQQLKQELGDFNEDLFQDGVQRLRFEGYICYLSDKEAFFWKGTEWSPDRLRGRDAGPIDHKTQNGNERS